MNFVKEKTVCFSGHRSERLPKHPDTLQQLQGRVFNEIEKAVNYGYNTFIFGACYGFDIMCAQMVVLLQRVIKFKEPIEIRLIAVVPFEEQASKWREQDRESYFNILGKCDDVITLSTRYHRKCYHERNIYMVDNSSRLICYYDGNGGGTGYTVDYAVFSLPYYTCHQVRPKLFR